MVIDRDLILKAKEKIKNIHFELMMNELGIEDYDKRNKKCCCPFHPESTPSFIWRDDINSAHCFGACHKNFDIIDVLISKGFTYIEAVQKLFDYAEIDYSFGEHKVKTEESYKYPHEEPLNDKSKILEYLKLRCISKETVDYLDLREDSKGNIVFNYYDTNDVLTMVKYRLGRKFKKGVDSCKVWCQPKASTAALLFNMNRINLSQPLIITCGELDCAALIECGFYNSVSIHLGDGNLEWIDKNWDWLGNFNEIVLCPDNDSSGEEFLKRVIPMLGASRCSVVKLPYKSDKGTIKDINECLYKLGKDVLKRLVNSAELPPITSVIDFCDITPCNYESFGGVEFGISKIDRILRKNYFGTVTIITGYPGSGKSSLLNQLIANALDSGVKTWWAGREFSEGMNQNWLLHTLAGENNLEEYTDKFQEKYYTASKESIRNITSYYKDSLFVYRDECGSQISEMIESMELLIRRKGVKLVIVDNLMMVDGEDDNEFKGQTYVMEQLTRIAVTYKVKVFLVAHPKKTKDNTEAKQGAVSGTMNIENMATRVLALRKVEGKSYDVELRINKDRVYGKVGSKIELNYDVRTRRFFTNEKEYYRRFKWDKSNSPRKLDYPIKEGVFDEPY